MRKAITFLLLSLLLGSCKSVKPAEQTQQEGDVFIPKEAVQTDLGSFFYQITKPQQFSALKINSKITVDTDQYIPALNGTLYIEKNEKIWLNLSALFITVARGMAEPDHLRGYETINKTYIDSKYEYLNHLLGVDFLNYMNLQNLFTGKSCLPILPKDFDIKKTDSAFLLESKKNTSPESLYSRYTARIAYNKNYELETVQIQEQNGNNSLRIDYSERIEVGNDKFPKFVKITMSGDKNGVITLENTNFDTIRMNTPFQIPKKYAKASIQ